MIALFNYHIRLQATRKRGLCKGWCLIHCPTLWDAVCETGAGLGAGDRVLPQLRLLVLRKNLRRTWSMDVFPTRLSRSLSYNVGSWTSSRPDGESHCPTGAHPRARSWASFIHTITCVAGHGLSWSIWSDLANQSVSAKKRCAVSELVRGRWGAQVTTSVGAF